MSDTCARLCACFTPAAALAKGPGSSPTTVTADYEEQSESPMPTWYRMDSIKKLNPLEVASRAHFGMLSPPKAESSEALDVQRSWLQQQLQRVMSFSPSGRASRRNSLEVRTRRTRRTRRTGILAEARLACLRRVRRAVLWRSRRLN